MEKLAFAAKGSPMTFAVYIMAACVGIGVGVGEFVGVVVGVGVIEEVGEAVGVGVGVCVDVSVGVVVGVNEGVGEAVGVGVAEAVGVGVCVWVVTSSPGRALFASALQGLSPATTRQAKKRSKNLIKRFNLLILILSLNPVFTE